MTNKIMDYFVRFLILALFLTSFFAPAPIVWSLTFLVTFVVGLWAVLFPQGILLWLKTAHPEIDETNPRLWSVPRFIGGAFMLIAATFGLVFLMQR